MIRKILLSAIAVFTIQVSNGQVCTPDTNFKQTGLSPNVLPHAKVNVKYEESITVNLFRDTTAKVGPFEVPVTIDSMIVLQINGMPDHLHIFFGMRPTQSLADLMKKIKGDSSLWVNKSGFIKRRFS